MPERTLQIPDWAGEFGTADQCAAFVGITPTLWLELDAAGLVLPPAARASRQTAVWHWHAAVAVSLQLTQLTGKLATLRAEQRSARLKKRKKVGGTGAHSPARGAQTGESGEN